jgi:predicted nucleic acid-binding protein
MRRSVVTRDIPSYQEEVFTDTGYFVALVIPHDDLHERAIEWTRQKAGKVRYVTTVEVLVKFLSFVAGYGQYYRNRAAAMVRQAFSSKHFRVIELSITAFEEGLELYESRPDKEYSLVDCISMIAMRHAGMKEILSYDHHFEQEGFVTLLR